LPSDWLTTLHPDGQGGLWIGTERAGLAHLDAHGQWSYQPLPQSAGAEVTAIAQDDGRLLVGTLRGLWTLADERWRPLFPGAVDGPRQINDLLVQDKGQLWIAADAGLYISHDGRSLERVYSNQAPI